MEVLILHLQAPLMSFGSPQVDQIGPTARFPTISQITGLLANALGYKHGDFDRLQALQERLSIASALVREGEELQDYQTVDLGQTHLRNPAWTTRGRTEHRAGGPGRTVRDTYPAPSLPGGRQRAERSGARASGADTNVEGDWRRTDDARAASVHRTETVPAIESTVRRYHRRCRQPYRRTDTCARHLPRPMVGDRGPGWPHRGHGRVASSRS